jgi:hypothetical protein
MGFGTQKNVHIENWAAFRENCEHSFKFTRSNWAKFLVFGIGVPFLAYIAIAGEMVSSLALRDACRNAAGPWAVIGV